MKCFAPIIQFAKRFPCRSLMDFSCHHPEKYGKKDNNMFRESVALKLLDCCHLNQKCQIEHNRVSISNRISDVIESVCEKRETTR